MDTRQKDGADWVQWGLLTWNTSQKMSNFHIYFLVMRRHFIRSILFGNLCSWKFWADFQIPQWGHFQKLTPYWIKLTSDPNQIIKWGMIATMLKLSKGRHHLKCSIHGSCVLMTLGIIIQTFALKSLDLGYLWFLNNLLECCWLRNQTKTDKCILACISLL